MAKAWGYAGYASVRLQEESPNEFGLQTQRAQIERYFAEKLVPRGIEWGDMLADPADAKGERLADLPTGATLLKLAQVGDHVLIANLHPAFRMRSDLANVLGQWLAKGVYFHFQIPDPSDGWIDSSDAFGHRFAARVVEIIASGLELDRNTRSAKISAPLGFKVAGRGVNQRLVPDDESREQMVFIAERVAEGLQFPKIRDLLNKNKMRWKKPVPMNRRRSGRVLFSLEPWSPQHVRKFYTAWQCICEREGLELLTGQRVDQSALPHDSRSVACGGSVSVIRLS